MDTTKLYLFIILFCGSLGISAQVFSFPGAEGYGRFACVNQPAKSVYFVTNLNDSGPGSLRDGLSQSNRYIIFKVAGTITLNSTIIVNASNIYIAGQTAFLNGGEGITIKSDGIQKGRLITFDGDHTISRYLRLRRGGGSNIEVSGDNMNWFGDNWIADHCSFSWSTDENIGGSGDTGTLQYCISSEGLYFSSHSNSVDPTDSEYQGGHSKGSLFGSSNNPASNITIYRNLFAHNDARAPRIASPGSTHEIVNNLMYNNRFASIELNNKLGQDIGNMKTNVVKNLLIAGEDTKTTRYMVHAAESEDNQIYMQGNIGVHRETDNDPEWAEVGERSNPISEIGRSLTAFSSPLQAEFSSLPDALGLEAIVLADVGANIKSDEVDQRLIQDVINRTPTIEKSIEGTHPTLWRGSTNYYGIINDPSEVGGWPFIEPMTSMLSDSDNDGMPDAWELANNLNPNDPSDMLADYGNGYPNIEIYLHEIINGEIIDIDTMPVDTMPVDTMDANVCNIILKDDFENGFGNWMPTGPDAGHGVSANSPNGNASVFIQDDDDELESSIVSPFIDLTNIENFSINFKYRPIGMDGVEYFYLEISTDGSNFNTLVQWVHGVDFSNGIVYNEIVDLVNTYGDAMVQFRITCNGSNNGDQIYLDDIEIEACTSDCADFLLQNTNSIITESEHVQIEIESDGIVPSGNTIDFVAGSSILLTDEFEVENGAVFHAYIESCN